MTKYFKKFKDEGEAFEITKEQARETLDGYWTKESLDDIFDNDKAFRLFTPYSFVWTNQDGTVPMAGWFGIVG